MTYGLPSKKRIRTLELFFENKIEHSYVRKILSNLTPDQTSRNIAVLVNPVSGKRRSRRYYREVFLPMMTASNIAHEVFVTTGEKYVSNWVSELDADNIKYTEFALIGGDGLFSQFLNALVKHPQADQLLKIPIGMMPGGSQNAIGGDLGGKNEYISAGNIIQGRIVKSDIMQIHFKEQGRIVYGTSGLWGIAGSIVEEAERWRNVLGSCKYTCCGMKRFFGKCRLLAYNCRIKYRNEANKKSSLVENTENVGFDEEDKMEEIETASQEKVDETTSLNPTSTFVHPFKENSAIFKNDFSSYHDNWRQYGYSDLLFLAILTHEARSSLSGEMFIPWCRFNDGKMNIGGFTAAGKVQTLRLLKNMADDGNHIRLKRFHAAEATEVRLLPISASFFNIDGEIFPNDELYIKLLPGLVNMFGTVHKLSKNASEYKQEMQD